MEVLLHFRGHQLELIETRHSKSVREFQRCNRGIYPLESCTGTFAWTKAVQALTILCLETAACADCEKPIPSLSGRSGSLAGSLDGALDRQPNWLAEVFGTDSNSRCLSPFFFSRSNPRGKRVGDIVISLNSKVRVTILDSYTGQRMNGPSVLTLLRKVIRDTSSPTFIDQSRRVLIGTTLSEVCIDTNDQALINFLLDRVKRHLAQGQRI